MKMEIKGESLYLKSKQHRMPFPYECLQFVLQDHNYGAPPPCTPPPDSSSKQQLKQQPLNGFGISETTVEDDGASIISSEPGREGEPESEETETAPEGEGDDENSITRCICDFEHDDGYMICCDRCLVWQHVDCMGIDRANIPDEYLCEVCRPRRVDRARARALQMRKRQELLNSDTSSDSSISSVDPICNVALKKRKNLKQHPSSVSKKKSNSSAEVPELGNNNNNNLFRKQEKDTHLNEYNSSKNSRELSLSALLPMPKQHQRGSGKRKIKRCTSVTERNEETHVSWGSTMVPLRQWIERYEEAVTNHYSPELRARISCIKVNGMHNDLTQNYFGSTATGKCKLTIHSKNLRILVATMHLSSNMPIVELRGKYMLSTQHRLSYVQSRQHIQRPGPFVFFYRLPRDGTEICVDTRTYGNEARFVRRSCKPNAEIKHCIEKGMLHLYIVTTIPIPKNTEITIRHDQHDLAISPNTNLLVRPLTCACNNSKHCQIINLAASSMNKKGSYNSNADNLVERERRRRSKRKGVVDNNNESLTKISAAMMDSPLTTPIQPLSSNPISQGPKKKIIMNIINITDHCNKNDLAKKTSNICTNSSAQNQEVIKAEPTQSIAETLQSSQSSSCSVSVAITPLTETFTEMKKDKKKMTREERKMEAIIKAFERLEKAEQRKQEVQARNAQRKEFITIQSDNEDSSGYASIKSKQGNIEKTPSKKNRKGRTRRNSTSQTLSTSRKRLNSAESDLTSGDESNRIQSPVLTLPNETCSYSLQMHTASSKVSGQSESTKTGISTAAGLLLALANSSNAIYSNSLSQQRSTSVKSPSTDSTSSSSQSSTPSTPLSSACLLVAAAVGPLEPDFKFPKTKKVLMNEWLRESPVSKIHTSNIQEPKFYCVTKKSSDMTHNYANKSLSTLVQAAHSISCTNDSSHQSSRRSTATINSTNVTVSAISTGSAKKRWLRQAISEECDTPNSKIDISPSELLAPPKKRRKARENLSSDNSALSTISTIIQQDNPHLYNSTITEDNFIEPPYIEDPDFINGHDVQTGTTIRKTTEKMLQSKFKFKDFGSTQFIKEENEAIELHKIKDEIKSKVKRNSVNIIKYNVKSEREGINIKYETHEVYRNTESYSNIYNFPKIEEENNFKKSISIMDEGNIEIVDKNGQNVESSDFNSVVTSAKLDNELKKKRAQHGRNISDFIYENKLKNIIEDKNDLLDNKLKRNEFNKVSFKDFDVEAQMQKITGDDGLDCKETYDARSKKNNSIDGIERLLASSKDYSEFEFEDVYSEHEIKSKETLSYVIDQDKGSFKEIDYQTKSLKNDLASNRPSVKSIDNDKVIDSSINNQQSLYFIKDEVSSSKIKTFMNKNYQSSSSHLLEGKIEHSFIELNSNKSVEEPIKFFTSILPLSERIRKKVECHQVPKSSLEIEASMIESSFNTKSTAENLNIQAKRIMSSALRELLEAKLEPEEEIKAKSTDINLINSNICIQSELPESCLLSSHTVDEKIQKGSVFPIHKNDLSFVTKRPKDPRTAVPKKVSTTSATNSEEPTPIKRKLSISEYRKRKQQLLSKAVKQDNSDSLPDGRRSGRSSLDSASSGTSSLGSDDENTTKMHLDISGLHIPPLYTHMDRDDKKVNDEGIVGWSAAPTLVERQRENLTERLKREFGLFLNEDEEDNVRTQDPESDSHLNSSNIRIDSLAEESTNNDAIMQLPQQTSILPPDSTSIQYSRHSAISTTSSVVSYISYSVSAPVISSDYQSTSMISGSASLQHFIVSQAPPGSNPYPPSRFGMKALPSIPSLPSIPIPVPPPSTTVSTSVSRFSRSASETRLHHTIVYPLVQSQYQQSLYNYPPSRS